MYADPVDEAAARQQQMMITHWLTDRRSNRTFEPAPARPQVAPVKIETKKKPRKRGRRVVQQAIGAV